MLMLVARMRRVTADKRVRYPTFLQTKPTSRREGNGWYWTRRDKLHVPDETNPQFTDSSIEYILKNVVSAMDSSYNVRLLSPEGDIVWQRFPD